MFHPAAGLTYLDTATSGLPPDVYDDAADIERAMAAVGPLVAHPVGTA